jgi:hypothetical protein
MVKRKTKLRSLKKKLTILEKRKARLDASQNALRVVEQAIGGKGQKRPANEVTGVYCRGFARMGEKIPSGILV